MNLATDTTTWARPFFVFSLRRAGAKPWLNVRFARGLISSKRRALHTSRVISPYFCVLTCSKSSSSGQNIISTRASEPVEQPLLTCQLQCTKLHRAALRRRDAQIPVPVIVQRSRQKCLFPASAYTVDVQRGTETAFRSLPLAGITTNNLEPLYRSQTHRAAI